MTLNFQGIHKNDFVIPSINQVDIFDHNEIYFDVVKNIYLI